MIRFLGLAFAAGLAATAAQAQDRAYIAGYRVDEAAFEFQMPVRSRSGMNAPLIPQVGGGGAYDLVLCNASDVEGGYDGPDRKRQSIPANSCVPLYGVVSVNVWPLPGKPEWHGKAYLRSARSQPTP